MLVCIRPLIALLLGPLWAPSARSAAVLLLLAIWVVWSFLAGVAVVARGRARPALLANLASLALTVLGLVVARPDRPIAAALIWSVAQLAVAPYLLAVAARATQGNLRDLLGAGLAPLVLAAAAAAVGLVVPSAFAAPDSPAILIPMRLLCGGVVYFAGAQLLMPDRVAEALRLLGFSLDSVRPRGWRRRGVGVRP
jgi:hypothetical protein